MPLDALERDQRRKGRGNRARTFQSQATTMMDDFEDIAYSDAGAPVAYVTIKTGGKENWFTAKTFAEMDRAIQEAEANPEVLFLVFRSGVDGVFSYGCDVTTKDDIVDAEPLIRAMVAVARRMLERRVICIAKVDGVCVGGGWELVMLCTLSYASERSLFRLPEILVECQPPIATAIYPALVGRGKALDHLWTARVLPARKASNEGVITEAFPDESFKEDFRKTMTKLSEASKRRSFEAIRAAADGDQGLARRMYDEMAKGAAEASSTLLERLIRQTDVIAEFPEALRRSLTQYKELVEGGVIQEGIKKYWATRREGKRHIRDTPQGFSLDGLIEPG